MPGGTVPALANANDPVYVAMWSGPRNISTAMMRSFSSRSDTAVVDEPLYAHYLVKTGIHHPGREEIIKSQDINLETLIPSLIGQVPDGKRIYFEKHMVHHLLDEIPRDWIRR